MTLNSYYNRFNPDKEYEKSLFLAGRGLQSAELNETQEYALSKLKDPSCGLEVSEKARKIG